jgi:hypothetical protein
MELLTYVDRFICDNGYQIVTFKFLREAKSKWIVKCMVYVLYERHAYEV